MLAMRVAYLIQKEAHLEIQPTDLLLETLERVASIGEAAATPLEERGESSVPPDLDGVARPMFFGLTGAELFGVYHSPRSAVERDVAIIICPGFGPEYIAAHGSLRQLADRFARAGFPVLRFDFFGCGDSVGSASGAGVEQWVDDVATAARHLRETSGTRRVCVVGLRLGATLGMLAGMRACLAGGEPLFAAVLWEPITSGKAYVDGMLADHEAWLRSTFGRAKQAHRAGGPQIMGFELPVALQQQMGGIDLLRGDEPLAENVLLVQNAGGSNSRALQERLGELIGRFESMRVEDHPPWVGRHGNTIAHGSMAAMSGILDWVASLSGGAGHE